MKAETLPEIPKNIEAERQVLAACLLNAAERGRVFECLRKGPPTGPRSSNDTPERFAQLRT